MVSLAPVLPKSKRDRRIADVCDFLLEAGRSGPGRVLMSGIEDTVTSVTDHRRTSTAFPVNSTILLSFDPMNLTSKVRAAAEALGPGAGRSRSRPARSLHSSAIRIQS